MRIRIRLITLWDSDLFNADPEPDFYLIRIWIRDADPNLSFQVMAQTHEKVFK
jgi:hypothetical protein